MIRYRTTSGLICQFVMCYFIILFSCKQAVESVDDLSLYYLPVDSLTEEGWIYSYKSLVDTTLESEVWQHIKTSPSHITSINFDHNQQVVQKQYERIVGNGVLIDSLVLFFRDSNGAVISNSVKVISPHRYPFDVADSSRIFLTQLEWWQPEDSLHVVLERRRQFIGDTTWIFQGRKIPAIRFLTRDKFETEDVGWTSSEWSGEEIYGHNTGLVYYRRNISQALRIEFELEKIDKGPMTNDQ